MSAALDRDGRRIVAHVDMDAFFVSVELLRRPELRGKPVVVATGTDAAARGVVMAASYEARRFGVHSALPLAIAHRRCPQATLIPRDIGLYRRASRKVMDVLRRFSDRVEVAGLDEAYLDLSDCPAPKARARQLKREVHAETRLVCSVGLAPNKLLAKIASDLDKPDGLCVLEPERMLEAVGERPATLIPGVGPRTAQRLAQLGVRTVAELAAVEAATLERAFGPRLGRELRDRARGHDERPVVTEREPKSESRETTFPSDVTDLAILQRHAGPPRRVALPRARRRRLRGSHGDAEDPPAALPYPHALADPRGADTRPRAGALGGPPSCWPSSSSTPRCAFWGLASPAWWPWAASKRDRRIASPPRPRMP